MAWIAASRGAPRIAKQETVRSFSLAMAAGPGGVADPELVSAEAMDETVIKRGKVDRCGSTEAAEPSQGCVADSLVGESAAEGSETAPTARMISDSVDFVTDKGLKPMKGELAHARHALDAANAFESINGRRHQSAVPVRETHYFAKRIKGAGMPWQAADGSATIRALILSAFAGLMLAGGCHAAVGGVQRRRQESLAPRVLQGATELHYAF